jgi:hypothetical protein
MAAAQDLQQVITAPVMGMAQKFLGVEAVLRVHATPETLRPVAPVALL